MQLCQIDYTPHEEIQNVHKFTAKICLLKKIHCILVSRPPTQGKCKFSWGVFSGFGAKVNTR
jgi:hypothetical protein